MILHFTYMNLIEFPFDVVEKKQQQQQQPVNLVCGNSIYSPYVRKKNCSNFNGKLSFRQNVNHE